MRFPKLPPSVYTMCVQGTELVSTMVAWIVVARMLGPDAMGDYVFAFALAAVLSLFIHFGTGEIAIRMYALEKENPQEILAGTLVVWLAGSVIAVLIATVVGVVMGLTSQSFVAVWLVLASLLVNGISMLFQHAILALASSHRDLPVMIISRVVLLAIVVWGGLEKNLYLAISASVAGAAVLTLGRAFVVNKYLFTAWPRFSKSTLLKLWRSGSKLGIGSVFGVISVRSDALLLKYLTTNAIVGYYGIAFKVVSAVVQGSLNVSTALYPGLLRAIEDDRMTLGRRLFVLFPVGVVICVVFAAIFLADVIINVLVGPEYAPAIPIIRILLVTAGFHCIHVFANTYLIAIGMEKVVPWSHGVSATINLTLNILLIPLYQGVGAASATLCSETVAVGILLSAIVVAKLKKRGRGQEKGDASLAGAG